MRVPDAPNSASFLSFFSSYSYPQLSRSLFKPLVDYVADIVLPLEPPDHEKRVLARGSVTLARSCG